MTMEPLADEVLTMVHAFGDSGRKSAVRSLATRIDAEITRLKSELAAARRDDAKIVRVTRRRATLRAEIERLTRELSELKREVLHALNAHPVDLVTVLGRDVAAVVRAGVEYANQRDTLRAENERLREVLTAYTEADKAELCATCGHREDAHPYQSNHPDCGVDGCTCRYFAGVTFDDLQELRSENERLRGAIEQQVAYWDNDDSDDCDATDAETALRAALAAVDGERR